jgi:hypothetical protein
MVYGKIARSALCLALGMVGFSGDAIGQVVTSPTTKVTRLVGYSQAGGGDVVFETSIPTPGCEGGFWLRATDPGFASLLSMVITYRASREDVRIYAESAVLWTGSSNKYCHVYGIANP